MTKTFRVLFVDGRLSEVIRQWELSDCEKPYPQHDTPIIDKFDSIERTCSLVESFHVDLVLVGYDLGKPGVTGADVIRVLRQKGYEGYIIANSGGGIEQFERAGVRVDGDAKRNPHDLKVIVDKIRKGEK